MAFKLIGKPTFFFKVTVKQPNDNGTFASYEFRAEFKHRSQQEIDELIKTPKRDDEILESEWIGWKDVKQADGVDLEVNPVNRTALLAEPGVRTAIVKAWLEACVFGHAKN